MSCPSAPVVPHCSCFTEPLWVPHDCLQRMGTAWRFAPGDREPTGCDAVCDGQAGNTLFQNGDHSGAAEAYKAGLAVAQPDQAPLKAVLHCNRAAAMHALDQHAEAVADCCAAIALDASYLKAYQRRAEAAMALGDTATAVQVVQLTGPCCGVAEAQPSGSTRRAGTTLPRLMGHGGNEAELPCWWMS